MKIFLSYRRADSTYLIGRIKDRLEAAFGSNSVFRDLDDIPAGVDFRTVLEKETQACQVMLVIIGPQWAGVTDAHGNKRLFNPADYTRIEVETGIQGSAEKRSMLVPVLVMNAPMPSPQDLPETLAPLTFQNAISIRNDPDFNNDIERLVRDIRQWRGMAEDDISIAYFEPKTIHIGEGLFWMGSATPQTGPGAESPTHEVFLPSYRIGKYPVTNAQYEEFIRETGKLVTPSMGWDGQRFPKEKENLPVAGITFYEALAYCQWLTEKTGRKYALPNEAQWEKACRAGAHTFYPWGNEFESGRSNHGSTTLAAVDAFPAQNEFGCFDMVGNLQQWTCSLWGEKRIAQDPAFAYPWKNDRRNDLNASRQIRRVLRGSSMKDDVNFLRCSYRSGQAPDDPGFPGARTGFRVAVNE